MSNQLDNEDLAQAINRPLEEEAKEAASAEFHELLDFSHGDLDGDSGSLLAKIEDDPTLSFRTSDQSSYNDNRWLYATRSGEKVIVTFTSRLAGGNELYKQLIYHLIPEFHPYGKVRSYRSTRTYSYACDYLDWYLLSPNGLDATPESIRTITVPMINRALDMARDEGIYRHYSFLYFILAFWISLSAQKLISRELRLDIPLNKVVTKARQKSVQEKVAAETQGWKPYTEGELSSMVEYALFWTEEAMPTLMEIRDFIVESLSVHKVGFLVRSKPDLEIEEMLGKKVKGVTVCGYETRPTKAKITSSSGRELEYDYIAYTWKNNYRVALDNVMQGILVLFSLITGLRSSELAELDFDDITQSGDGEYTVNVVRFKTSNDPNYFGEPDAIPLPDFLGEIITQFKQLREVEVHMRTRKVFYCAKGGKVASIMARSIQKSMKRIGEVTGIDGVHPHRFRKTIAEMLINRSERNIDVIRMLFGHRSYKMTLRYIARNPYIISSVAEAIETHYAQDFINLVSAVQGGGYSGSAAERIAAKSAEKPLLFKGKLLRMTIYNYIAYLIEAGEPVFIKRASVGVYCVSNDEYSADQLPPCLEGKCLSDGPIQPDTSNCKLDCKNAVVLSDAKGELEKNISFYRGLLDGGPGMLSRLSRREIERQIKINEVHLSNLGNTKCFGKASVVAGDVVQ
ncbi:tyrosine-type recombinase/integrase [Congregibacter litoralis]|uniref:Integrase n=1 Tax=Congregibacter litoralis KT71 TaxID=314285 RepID=A4A8F7_9GAMM|nr:tyrosine-type recombinase/integrase [Congregibacter litoralis]EAQ97952.1 Integrase [Congregibacter litoralis KT71]